MKLTRAKKLAIGLAVVCLLGLTGFVGLYYYEKVPLSELLSIDFWLRQAKGTANYDPGQAILFRGNPKLKEVALTIDDGPHELYGPEVLDVLRQYQVPATFFVVGVRVKACPDLIRRMVLEGHEIGNHTYDHLRLNTLKPHEIANELRDDDVNIFEAAGIHTTIMRPPGVRYDNQVLKVSQSLGYVTISWTTAAKDYLNQSPDYIVRSVVDRTENGSIILLHQDNPYTAEALPRIITALKAKGYKFVTISTMLAHLNVQPYAAQQKAAELAANGQPFVLANGRTVLTGETDGGPEVSRYVPPIFAPIRKSPVEIASTGRVEATVPHRLHGIGPAVAARTVPASMTGAKPVRSTNAPISTSPGPLSAPASAPAAAPAGTPAPPGSGSPQAPPSSATEPNRTQHPS